MIFTDDGTSARNAISSRIIAKIVVNNPEKTVLFNETSSNIDNARVEQIPFTINEIGSAVLHFNGNEYMLIMNIPIQHIPEM